MDSLRIDIWSDVACPWCWVGKRHLEGALDRFAHPVQVVWRAFELNPTAPKAADIQVDYVGRLARKYGVSRGQGEAMIERMTQTGLACGVEFRFERIRPGNTFDAHRLLHWSLGSGKQNVLKERLFVAYMNEGKNLSDHSVLAQLAADVGFDEDAAQAVLRCEEYADAVRADLAAAGQLGITGVPFFAVGGRYAVPGAQPPDVLLSVLHRAWDDKESEEEDAPPGSACSDDVCPVPE